MKKLHLVCNAHLDPVWLWRKPEGMAEAMATFRIAADFCERYDNFVFNHNESVDVLKTQTIPAQTLNYHHWAMLTQEIEFLETDQDIERFAYKVPRSVFVLPWIESLILFGVVK